MTVILPWVPIVFTRRVLSIHPENENIVYQLYGIVKPNLSASWMKRTFIWIHPHVTRTTVCGPVDIKLTLNLINCWLNGISLPLVIVSAGVCIGRNGHLYFVDEKAKVNAAYYLKTCGQNWWKIVNSCYRMVSSSSKMALRLTRHASEYWLKSNCRNFITNVEWSPVVSDLSSLDFTFGGQCWSLTVSCSRSQKTVPELKDALLLILLALPQKSIDNIVKDFCKRLQACDVCRVDVISLFQKMFVNFMINWTEL